MKAEKVMENGGTIGGERFVTNGPAKRAGRLPLYASK